MSLRSLLSESGVVLTHATMDLDPGRKPQLRLRLPEEANFWACYVNQRSVWPSIKEGDLLVPLEPSSGIGEALCQVELVYTMAAKGDEIEHFSWNLPPQSFRRGPGPHSPLPSF